MKQKIHHKEKPSNSQSLIGNETLAQKSVIIDASKLNKDLRLVFKMRKQEDYDDPIEKYIKE